MTEYGLTDTVRQRAELGADIPAATKFLNSHQKLLHDIEVCLVFIMMYSRLFVGR